MESQHRPEVYVSIPQDHERHLCGPKYCKKPDNVKLK